MQLSIIIPHHEEEDYQVNNLFSSLNNQLGVNFQNVEIIVVHDSDKALDYSSYPYIRSRIKEIRSTKTGYPGFSRQWGLDCATGDYVMFCDCDDQIYDSFSLLNVLRAIEGGKDIYAWNFIQEAMLQEGIDNPIFTPVYLPIDIEDVWIFSKAIKRSFLEEHNIRFSDDLRWCEDFYFNQILNLYEPSIERCPGNIYVWRYNFNSVTRRNEHEHSLSSRIDAVEAWDKIFEYADNHGLKPNIYGILQLVVMNYQYRYSPNDCVSKYIEIIESSTRDFIIKHNLLAEIKDEDNKGSIADIMHSAEVDFIPEEGFFQWVDRITKS